MYIKEIVLTNFKCHTNSHFQLGKTNHFFGDNFVGKSSIGEAIIFCLFGLTKHGYKGFVKDYLQEGKTSMKVQMNLMVNNQEYNIFRSMNGTSTTTVFLNNVKSNEKEIKELIGDYQSFVYCFFPEIFPQEDKNTARSFLINFLIEERNTLDDCEKEKNRIAMQQKSVQSSITFYEGQRSILKKQMENLPQDTSPIPENILQKKEQIKEELNVIQSKIENYVKEGYQLQATINSCNEKLKEIDSAENNIKEYCPTCHQPLPQNQLHTIRLINVEKKSALQKELEVFKLKIEMEKRAYMDLIDNKKTLEHELNELEKNYPSPQVIDFPVQQWTEVEEKLKELTQKKNTLAFELKKIKHQMGELANQYQNEINQFLNDTRIELFKQLKSGELRPDFQITYKNRPYRVLSNSEKVRCMLEIIDLINNKSKWEYPIFMDNLESLTHLNAPKTQVITATVKKGFPLTLKIKD
jgi:DNA repair exonuclease SbcCD ATPase subunit